MATLRNRTAKLERESVNRKSVHEMTTAELIAAIGLPPDATDDEIEIGCHERSGQTRPVSGLANRRGPDQAPIIDSLLADRPAKDSTS